MSMVQKYYKSVPLFLMPVFSFFCFEWVTGNLGMISGKMWLFNICWYGAVYLLFFLISGTTRISIPAAALFFYLLSLAETFVELFRGTPIMMWDFLALRTAASVAGNYSLEISKEMLLSGLLLLACIAFCWRHPFSVKGWKKRLILLFGGSGAIVGFIFLFYQVIMVQEWMYLNMWDLNYTYQEYGYITATAVSLKYMVKKAPAGYSHSKLKKWYQECLEQTEAEPKSRMRAAEDVIQPVNIICIMNESLSDLRVAGEFQTNQEYFPFLSSLTENTVRGSLCVPVFGGLTSNTEFEVLTGDSMAFLPVGSVAYQLYVNPGMNSLVSTLKNQGYRTVAVHPYPKENWNREVCYRNLGFDTFLDLDAFGEEGWLRNYTSDAADYQKLIELVEEKENNMEPLFLFNVTMQNHGGYEEEDENFKQEISLTGPLKGKYPWADQYLSLMKKSDEALQELIDYFSECETPTMIVLFGDHQPSVEDEFYDEIAGVTEGRRISNEERLMWYQTPLLIWTNYEQPSEQLGKLSSNYLSSYLLHYANLDMSFYQSYLYDLSKKIPVVHPIGCYDAQDTYYSWETVRAKDFAYAEEMNAYEAMAYNHSMDVKPEQDLFSYKSEGDEG